MTDYSRLCEVCLYEWKIRVCNGQSAWKMETFDPCKDSASGGTVRNNKNTASDCISSCLEFCTGLVLAKISDWFLWVFLFFHVSSNSSRTGGLHQCYSHINRISHKVQLRHYNGSNKDCILSVFPCRAK